MTRFENTFLVMKNWVLVSIAALFLFSSCEKDETPITPHTPGELQTSEIVMGTLYADQIWYNIESNTEVSRNNKTDWDLAFDCTDDGFHVLLNSANRMQVALTQDSNLSTVTDTNGIGFTWDSHTGNLDSTGIGNWKNTSNLYVIDRGRDEVGKTLGLRKIIFDSLVNQTYHFRFSDFDGTQWTQFTIEKDSNYTHSYFTFNNNGKAISIAPPKKDWDLCFTQYTYIYYYMNPMVAYLVTGVTMNRDNPFSIQVFDKSFEDINSQDILNYPSSKRVDNIGFDWKFYDFDNGYYVTLPSKNYIFRTQTGKMYKIHFLDWYNNKGEKGTPSFEYAEL